MRRCRDCAKWRENRGYCPVFAAIKPRDAKMCRWMAHEQNLEYMRGYMKEKYYADKATAEKAAKVAAKAKAKRKGSKTK